jgi:hypothetical protein
MLRKIIYSGDGRKKFILSSFPDIIEHAKEFEKSCATITSIIYATSDDPIVEIKNNNLTLFNIDALFQKDFKLKTMSSWDEQRFIELTTKKVDFAIVLGDTLSGKTSLCNHMAKHLGHKIIVMKSLEEQVKKRLGTEEEPFEGEVPIVEI